MIRFFRIGLSILLISGGGLLAAGDVLQLEDVISAVCTQSDSAQGLSENIRKSRLQIREQYANALPTISGQIFAGRAYGQGMGSGSGGGGSSGIHDSTTVTFGMLQGVLGQTFAKMYEADDAPMYSASLSISQPIYTFGKVGTAVKVANYYDSATQLSVKRSIQNLQLAGLDLYYGLYLADMALSVQQGSVERLQDQSEFLTRNFALGSGSKAQILSTNAELEKLKSDIMASKQSLKTLKKRLGMMIGQGNADSLELDTAGALTRSFIETLPSFDDALKIATENRDDLRSLDYMRKANDGGVKIFKAMYYPSIAAQAKVGTGGKDIENLFDSDYGTWQVGIGLQWTMFDGFANSAKALQYQSDSRKLAITRNMLLKMLSIEIDAALTSCVTADSAVVASEAALAAMKEVYQLTYDNFKQGSGQFTELQLAEERLRQCEFAIVSAKCTKIRNRAVLLVAMGKTIIPVEEK
jgi:HAE1 family hydrophobic/amphiphilic exporter-1